MWRLVGRLSVQENLVLSLKAVLTNTAVPPNILQTLLNLAEFMEHEVEASRACRV